MLYVVIAIDVAWLGVLYLLKRGAWFLTFSSSIL